MNILNNLLSIEENDPNEAKNNNSASTAASTPTTSNSNTYMADKLMEKVISMIIPNETGDELQTKIMEDRLEWQKTRPALSFAIMQKNSNMLHQRNSETYILFNNVLKFLNWKDPYYTIAILLVVTHIILKPYLISILPFVLLIIRTLIPHYLIIYPQESNKLSISNQPLYPPKIPKPAPLFSKEFFVNLTDTQNFMNLQIYSFDFFVWLTSDYFYFKNEQISSIILIGSLILIIFNIFFIPSIVHFLYLNFWILQISLISFIWTISILFHPYPREIILQYVYNEDTRMNCQNYVNKIEDRLTRFLIHDNQVEKFQESPELIDYSSDYKIVEIFELQKLNKANKIWEFIGFGNDTFVANSVIRKYNEIETDKDKLQLNVKESINDIFPPLDYKYVKDSKWIVDMDVSLWTKDLMIKDLVLIDDDEKWAYDIIIENENDNENDLNVTDDAEYYRRRRWIRKVVRENYKDKDVPQAHSHLAEWLR
ncbi:unnamed protein product [Candida verbasci]|uniref:TECPR1-like DysF domain-containing protein n=1 Tax=Candida verbasci TaxID=1227364 RepID=A0A9W4U0N5_9ASCO|nr:unnamed protein product [Candida verbasci]